MHEEVAAVVRDFMLDVDQRHAYAPMHERALSVIAGELAARYRDVPVGDRIQDESWRVLAEAYVRHSFWISNERGIPTLCEVLPAARILQSSFGTALRRIAGRFYVTASIDEQAILRGMPWGTADSFLDQWLERRRTARTPISGTIPSPTDADIARADHACLRAQEDIPGLSPDQVSHDVIGEVLAADGCGAGKWKQRVAHLGKADRLLDHDDASLGTAIGSRARSAVSALVFPGGTASRHDADGLRAAEIAAARLDRDAAALGAYAVALRHAGRQEDAEAAYDNAVDADPNNAYNLANYARFLQTVRGDYERAEQHYKRALDADPNNADVLGSYAGFLETVPGDDERAEQHYKRALDTGPNSANVLGSYASFLKNVRKEPDRAQELYERALAVDPAHANNLGSYARLLLAEGNDIQARALIEQAFENAGPDHDPLRAELWLYLYALGGPNEHDRALAELGQLIAKGVRSPGWDFRRIVARAVDHAHPHATWLPALTDVISDRADADSLAGWQAWRGCHNSGN